MLSKRKRSSDALSDAGTSHTEQTEASTPRGPVDERSRMLAERREQHAATKLQLEQQVQQAQEQQRHVAAQLEQLEGCGDSRDALGISDLRKQLQEYEQQEQQATDAIAKQQKQFETAVADILGIPAEQQSSQFTEAVQQQQQLQDAQVEQLAVVQQLADTAFAVTDVTKHQAKKARLDRINQVWNWLQDSNAASNGDTPTLQDSNAAKNGDTPTTAHEQQQQKQQQPQQDSGGGLSKQQHEAKEQTQQTDTQAADLEPGQESQHQEAGADGDVHGTATAAVGGDATADMPAEGRK